MTVEGPEMTKAPPQKRVVFLLFFLNLILLSWLLYATFGRPFTPSGGVSLVLINDTLTPMIEMRLDYPGGSLTIPRLDVRKSVGHPVPIQREFDAILSFKDEGGHPLKQTFHVKPVGEFLVVIYVLPVLEEAVVKVADGKEERVLRPSAAQVRIITSYQGENINI